MECEDGKGSEGVGAFRYSADKYSTTASVFCRVCEINCTCDTGYGDDTYRGSCTSCVTDKYKSLTDNEDSTSCDWGNGSSPQADSRCDVVYTGPDGDTCTVFVTGKYKSSTGSANCTDCGVGTYSTVLTTISTCITCPTNSNSSVGS